MGIRALVDAIKPRKAKIPRAASALEERLALQLRIKRLVPEREFKFHPTRRWRFDFAFLPAKVGIECHGGIWSGGRHNRGGGFQQDCVKYSHAALLGWRILHFTKADIDSGKAIGQIQEILVNIQPARVL